MRFIGFFKKYLSGKKKDQGDPADADALRIAFKSRYHHFKLLLNANNKALEFMADMERTLAGIHPFSINFVRSKTTSVSVNVYQMVKHIDALAPDKYSALFDRFNDIQQKIDRILTAQKQISDKRLILGLHEIYQDMADIVGAKMANLGEIKNKTNLRVPPGFVISAYACQTFFEESGLQTEIDRRFQSAETEDIEALYTLSSDVQQLIIRSKIPDNISDALQAAWKDLEALVQRPITVALRSSAMGEDASGSSFAGQYRSELNVSRENLADAYKAVVSSKYSLQAITYRLNKGFKDEDIPMSVGCLIMVNAKSGGVAYSRNPVDIKDDSIYINAAWGLPKSVVDGSMDCDLFVVSRKSPMEIVRREIKNKENKYVCYPEEGVCRMDLTGDDAREKPSITPQQAYALAEIAANLETYYGSAQDIEWALDENDEIFILQCRPLARMKPVEKAFSEIAVDENINPVIAGGGVTAGPGAATGPAYRVDRGEDVLRFPDGAVLIARQAIPRWATLLNRAVAVVTEQGGFAGHLANVAREFKVPALFGVSGVMEKINNGDLITVDATGRTLYRGEIKISATEPEKENIMAGSPVYETLKQVSRHVTPLHLLDPDAIGFNPKNCTTFHDITRFVHEKSVHEMFNFGKQHNFAERSGKQLYYKVPMQWWILNLDDGFKEEVKGKYVRLENIDCVPMLAFWEGFAAIPWEGPPAIDGRGLTSVMFQATTNTALTTGVRTRYSERNYFMVSKNYCSLNSRLGFHFSILEALVSDRFSENYVSFQFKGGAANFDRKLKRVMFIGDILEQFGFRVDIKEDTLISRVENREKQYMLDRVKILGYLTLHTRQLDMIMTNPGQVAFYRARIEKDIREGLKAEG
jgi:pyruvate, water dikinase